MGRVLAVTTVVDQVCDGTLPAEAAQSALISAGLLPPVSTQRFTCFAAVGAASLGVIFGALDATNLLLIAASAVIVLLICAGLLFGLAAVGANLSIGGSSPPVPLVIDVIAAGCAVASFGTFFSMPWRLLAFPIAAGMLAHAARWALITVGGESAATGALPARWSASS
jgi:hypothetical protein